MIYNLETIYRRPNPTNTSLDEAMKYLKIHKHLTLVFSDKKRKNNQIDVYYTDKHYIYSPKLIQENLQVKFLNKIKSELLAIGFENSKTWWNSIKDILIEKDEFEIKKEIKTVTINKDITDIIEDHQYEEQVNFLRNKDNVKMINKTYKKMSPRKHQEDAINISTNFLLEQYNKKWKGKWMLVLPTWFWKTFISAAIANKLKENTEKTHKPFRVLFLVHKNDIVFQTAWLYSKDLKWPFASFFDHDKMGILIWGEKDFHKCINNVFNKDQVNELVVANIRTLHWMKESLSKDHFDLIIADECHRSIWAQYKDDIEYFNYKYLLGVTATPSRTDEETWLTTNDLFNFYDNNVMYKKELLDVIENKILATPLYFIRWKDHSPEVEAELRKQILFKWYKTMMKKTKSELNNLKVFNSDLEYLNKEKKKTIVFCENIDIAEQIYKNIKKKNSNTIMMFWRWEWVNEKWKKIRQVWTPITPEIFSQRIQQFKDHDTEKKWAIFLVVVDLFIEWTDIPEVNAVMLLRPTESERIYFQILGRWLRKTETKKECLVLDYNFDTIKIDLLWKKIELLKTVDKDTNIKKYQDLYNLTQQYINSITTFINDFKNNSDEKIKYTAIYKEELLVKEVLPLISWNIFEIKKITKDLWSFMKKVQWLKYNHTIVWNKYLFSRKAWNFQETSIRSYFNDLYSCKDQFDILNFLIKTYIEPIEFTLIPIVEKPNIKYHLNKKQEEALLKMKEKWGFIKYEISPATNETHLRIYWNDCLLVKFYIASKKQSKELPLITI